MGVCLHVKARAPHVFLVSTTQKTSDPLEVKAIMWVLGTKPRSSAKVASALNNGRTICPAPWMVLRRERMVVEISALNIESWVPILSLFSCLCVSDFGNVILFQASEELL